MKTEIFFLSSGELDIRLNESYKKGKNTLLNNGFVLCENVKYMVKYIGKKEIYAHYNQIMKCWTLDN